LCLSFFFIFPVTICFYIYFLILFLVPFKTFLVFFSLCDELNWQLACQFFSVQILYRIVSYVVIAAIFGE